MFDRRLCLLAAVVPGVLSAGCDSAPRHEPSDRPAPQPEAVSIPGADVQVGFKQGELRRAVHTSDFRIARFPTSASQFALCVAAGVCSEVEPSSACASGAEGRSDGAGEPGPAVCVGEQNAEAYCQWVGGRVPTLAQWLQAARGPEVQRFAWGDVQASCEQHYLAAEAFLEPDENGKMPAAPDRKACALGPVLGRHSPGASPYGVEDVLITAGELLRSERDPLFPACGQSFDACVVFGTEAGAIDSVEPVHPFTDAEGQTVSSVTQPYSFRCVWSNEGKSP